MPNGIDENGWVERISKNKINVELIGYSYSSYVDNWWRNQKKARGQAQPHVLKGYFGRSAILIKL